MFLLYIYRMHRHGQCSVDVIGAWRPLGCSPSVASFARDVVGGCGPLSAVRARTLLWCCARLGSWGEGVGLEPVAEVLLHPSVIERFVVSGLAGVPPVRRRTLRTNLRFVARAAVPRLAPADPLALPRNRAKAPYSEAEVAAYLASADAQPTPARRHRLCALVCLGAGAGLRGGDLRHVRGEHIARRHGGVVVTIEGSSPRVVPVLARFHDRLLDAAAFAADGYVIGGRVPSRHNVTDRLVAAVNGDADLPRLELGRLRATWLATCAESLGLPAFFAAAGIVHSQHIGDVVAGLAMPDEAELVALLG